MKNLKKVLSLVLALAMALSLMTVAFAADASDYTDIDDVTYNEAVGVMTAVGVFQGNDGKFSPSATLDRASAAKLIAYLDLGASQADALTATGTMFSDVSATHWAAGYIEYMAAAGYSNGVGGGKFNPSGTVTALEFGKWLLTVLGYDASIEKLTGDVWAINTSKLANSIELFDGVDAKANLPMTREAAAVYCLNALEATCVKYAITGTSITIGDTVVNTGASGASAVDTGSNINKFNTDGKLQLTEKLYGAKLQKTVAPDAFGRPATSWQYDTKDVGTYTAEATATYENGITNATLYGLFGKTVADNMIHYSVVGNTDSAKYYTTVHVNGATIGDTSTNYYQFKNNSSSVVFATRGSTTEVFKDSDAKTIDIVVTETFVGKAAADYNTNTKKLSALNLPTGTFLNQKTEDQSGFQVSGFKKDDFFLYTKVGNTVKSVTPAETMSGVVSSYIKGTSVTVDGKEYKYSQNFYVNDENTKDTTYTIGETATFVMDGKGNIIAIVEVSASADNQYVFVENIGVEGSRNPVVMANIVNTDGTEKDNVTIKSINKETNTTVIADSANGYRNAGWYAYTMDSDKYKLTSDATKQYYTIATNTATLTETGKITVGHDSGNAVAAKANSATVFIVKDKDDKIVTYTGIANVPTIKAKTSATAFAYYLKGTDGFAKYVFIDLGDVATTSAATTTDADMFYVLKQSGLKVVSDTVSYYTLDVLKDGKVQNVDVLSSADSIVDQKGLFVKAKANSDNRVTDATKVTSKSDVKNFGEACADAVSNYYVSYSKNVLTLKKSDKSTIAKQWVVADDAVVYVVMNKGCELMTDVAADYEIVTVTAEQLAGMLNGYNADFSYTTFNVSDESDTVKTIYFTLSQVHEV